MPYLLRKKDHGRAEALLIAAYGLGVRGTAVVAEEIEKEEGEAEAELVMADNDNGEEEEGEEEEREEEGEGEEREGGLQESGCGTHVKPI